MLVRINIHSQCSSATAVPTEYNTYEKNADGNQLPTTANRGCWAQCWGNLRRHRTQVLELYEYIVVIRSTYPSKIAYHFPQVVRDILTLDICGQHEVKDLCQSLLESLNKEKKMPFQHRKRKTSLLSLYFLVFYQSIRWLKEKLLNPRSTESLSVKMCAEAMERSW